MGLRTISLRVRSAPALEALWTLERSPSVGEALRVALGGELERVREPLSILAECLWWLGESKAFRRDKSAAKACSRWRPGRPVRASALFEGELALDVHALVGAVESGDESARVTSVATRTVVEAVNKGALVVAEEARSGRKHVEVGALAKEVRAHLERAERAAERAAAVIARELERAKSAERARRERAQREKREREDRAQSEREARSEKKRARAEQERRAQAEREAKEREANERREREQREREQRERAQRDAAKAHAKGRKKSKPTSFGGLPDDAVPEDRSGEREVLSARGLTPDAEFFLTEASLGWPCEGRALDAARKALLLRFHPDRAGEAGVEKFQRAMRGYHSLVRALEKLSTGARTAEHGSRVAAAHATQPPAASEERREPSVSSDDRAQTERARKARAPREDGPSEPKRRGDGRAKPSAQPVRGAAVGEWPPRARTS
ncbi:MAG: hypothetical protein U0269_20000 [Polyangiales bacterium]